MLLPRVQIFLREDRWRGVSHGRIVTGERTSELNWAVNWQGKNMLPGDFFFREGRMGCPGGYYVDISVSTVAYCLDKARVNNLLLAVNHVLSPDHPLPNSL